MAVRKRKVTRRNYRDFYKKTLMVDFGSDIAIHHINENKTDNRACNLEWCTRTGNNNHGTRNERAAKSIAKALSKPVGQYTRDGELVKIWPSTMEVQRQAGFSQGNISKAANGNRKTAYGFIWKYKNETMEEK